MSGRRDGAACTRRQGMETLMPVHSPEVDGALATYELLRTRRQRWLVTGSAGFIGSHLLEALLRLELEVVSLDSFATGYRRNLEEVRRSVGAQAWQSHTFIQGAIVDLNRGRRGCNGV